VRSHTGAVSVCIPALDEAATIGPIVKAVVDGLLGREVAELVVVDDGSVDATAEIASAFGASVVPAEGSAPGRPVGKGGAMATGLAGTNGDIVVFCDADLTNFTPDLITRLLEPLADPAVMLVKADYRRTLGSDPDGGGRVTELLARPLVRLLFPHLAGIRQPLAGEIAGRRSAFESVEFEAGYAVDLALIIDIAERSGPEAIAQAHLGIRQHRNRPLSELGAQADAILEMALRRAGVDLGRLSILRQLRAG
jgi:glucosyl-3-phosphoglycerate synthase